MALRVTPQITVQHLLKQSAAHSAKIGKLQQQISSGVRISRPSDDPHGTKTVLSRMNLLAQYEAEGRTLKSSGDRLQQANSELLSISTLVVKARDIASQARNSLDDNERLLYANQIDQILEQVRTHANSQFNGEYLFSGDASQTVPYPDSNGQYAGSPNSLDVAIFGTGSLKIAYAGSKVFGSLAQGSATLTGTTGARPGAGTSTAVANANLQVRNTSTTFAPGSGVASGTSAVGGDTVLGPAAQSTLTIVDTSGTGAAGTISLNGGPAIPFTNADTNLQVTGPNGEVAFLNTTAITAGFNGSIDLTTTGTLSADGGATTTPIDFTSAQSVTTADGKLVFVDTSGLKKAGTDRIEIAGNANLFQALANLRDDLRNTDGLSSSEFQDSLTRRVDDLMKHHEAVLSTIGSQAQTLKTIEDLSARLSEITLDAKLRLADVAATDIPAASVELTEASNLLQYTYAVTGQMFKTSLLDYIA